MKKLITFLLCLSIALCFGGPIQSRHAAVIAKKAGGGGPSYLIDEGFEGTGTPSGWYISGATFDYTGAPLDDAQSLRLSSNGQYAGYSSGGALDNGEVWGRFTYNPETLPASFAGIIVLQDSGFATVLSITVKSNGRLEVSSGSLFLSPTDAMTAGVEYYIYWKYKKGTGANAEANIGFSTTATRPTSGSKYDAGTTGSMTNNATQFQFQCSDGAVHVVDNFRLSTTTFD